MGRSDPDWAGDLETRRSTSASFVFFGNALVSASSKQQSVVATSSCEAEYYACCSAASDTMYLRQIASDLGMDVPAEIEADASSAVALASRRGLTRIRHMEVKFLWLQDAIDTKKITIRKIRSDENVTDMGTKHVDKNTMSRCITQAGLAPCDFGDEDKIAKNNASEDTFGQGSTRSFAASGPPHA